MYKLILRRTIISWFMLNLDRQCNCQLVDCKSQVDFCVADDVTIVQQRFWRLRNHQFHCIKIAQIRSFPWSIFFNHQTRKIPNLDSIYSCHAQRMCTYQGYESLGFFGNFDMFFCFLVNSVLRSVFLSYYRPLMQLIVLKIQNLPDWLCTTYLFGDTLKGSRSK